MRGKGYIGWLWVAALAFMSCAREEVAPAEGDKIAFYVKTQQAVSASSRALIENTGDLLGKQLPLYVTSEGAGNFSSTAVSYTDKGVWQSDKEWQAGQDYTFYAYIASPIRQGTDTQGGVSDISENGKKLTIQQPETYSTSEDAWADYLLSYRVSANGSSKGLVRLDLERVTACVELYMARSEKVGEVTIQDVTFHDVMTKASFSISYHAVSTDEENLYGMKNQWIVATDEDSKTAYSRTNVNLNEYTDSSDRFDTQYRVMRFLVVPQTLIDGATLSLNYTVDEGGSSPSTYTETFQLSDYTPTSWNRGHKIRYFIGIDTSIKLEGTVAPWKSVDYIETTLLPKN